MTTPRPSGKYSTYRGAVCIVVGSASATTTWIELPGETRMQEVANTDLGPVEKISTSATWRGGEVTLDDPVADGRIHFYTRDQGLAEREGLHGDWHSGWQGAAPADELVDVREQVTLLRGAGGAAPDAAGEDGA